MRSASALAAAIFISSLMSLARTSNVPRKILPSLAPTICEEYSLFNVENIQFGKYGYSKGKEHSKWAISVFKYINCFADLNHCPSQQNRGGNIVCFENEALHKIMFNAVQSIETCPE